MISSLRVNNNIRILWVLLVLHLLNISVNTVEPKLEHSSEDLMINEQESVVEIIVEQVLGYEETFIEYEDDETQEHKTDNKNNVLKQFLINFFESSSDVKLVSINKNNHFLDHEARLTNSFNEIDSPPPKV